MADQVGHGRYFFHDIHNFNIWQIGFKNIWCMTLDDHGSHVGGFEIISGEITRNQKRRLTDGGGQGRRQER